MLGMSLIMAKLKETAGSMIGMDIFVLNMERLLRKKVSFSYAFFNLVADAASFRITSIYQLFVVA